MKQGVNDIVDGGTGTALRQQSTGAQEHAKRTNERQSHRENDYSSAHDWPTNSILMLTIGADQGGFWGACLAASGASGSKCALLTKSDLDFAAGLGKN